MLRPRFRPVAEDRTFGRWLIALMVLGFVALVVAGLAIARITVENRAYTDLVVHTQDVRQAIAALQTQLEQSETARRGYLLTGAPQFQEGYHRTSRQLAPRLAALRRLTIDNPTETARIDRIARSLTALQGFRNRSVSLVAAGATDRARQDFASDASVTRIRAIRSRLSAMTATETGLLARRAAAQQAATRLSLVLTSIAAVLIVVVAILSLVTVARNVRDITRSRDDLRTLNDTLEDQVAERTADLTRANEEIQRFAYIVSHDLRSPLVNVMGFTAELDAATGALKELVDRADERAPDIVTDEAREAATADLPEAIGFIRTSTQKMDRLINAILRLSRQGRRVLTPEPLDLAAMVAGIRGSVQHRIDEEGAELTVQGRLPAVIADRLAVEQILSNLIENALKYTVPDRPARIAVSGRHEQGRAVIEVADNGRGIAPADHERVFDLFRRAGNQDKPGEGIGLAHVRALAYRLGGAIAVTSELGKGSTFRLSLPFVAQQDRAA